MHPSLPSAKTRLGHNAKNCIFIKLLATHIKPTFLSQPFSKEFFIIWHKLLENDKKLPSPMATGNCLLKLFPVMAPQGVTSQTHRQIDVRPLFQLPAILKITTMTNV